MSPEKPGILQRVLTFLLNIGADPADDEYTRTIKRIYWVTAAFGVLAGLGSTILYFASGNVVMGWLFFFSFVFFVGLFVEGVNHPRRFRTIAFVLLVYFVAAPALVTLLMGGIWNTDGTIMIGLMGPLLGLVYLRDRRQAAVLFILYCALVMGLAVFEPGLKEGAAGRFNLDPVVFWLGFVVVGAFIFGVIYFFVVQRDRAHQQLSEKRRSPKASFAGSRRTWPRPHASKRTSCPRRARDSRATI